MTNYRNTFTAVICTVLFSSTMVLSAVGPARAAAPASNPPAVAHFA